jgi:hypothetical protein
MRVPAAIYLASSESYHRTAEISRYDLNIRTGSAYLRERVSRPLQAGASDAELPVLIGRIGRLFSGLITFYLE